MPQSLSRVIVHFVWSAKDRYPFINEESRKALHGYLATLCQDLGCHCNFQDEYRKLLIRHGVEFDERYVWD